MGKALYRKYRPTKLEDVIGQPQVTDVLKNALSSGKLSHAYLFTGPRGCGKTSVARIFAHEINKFNYELEDNYVDIIEIDAASNTGVDNIRDLREKAIIAPTEGKYKVYIIDEVHMLSKSAFNALLKTLEEPPEHVIFIMATTNVEKVLETILSRVQVYKFNLAPAEIMIPHIKNICEKESIKIQDDALVAIVKKGGGSFRDTISILDQISAISESEITISDIENAFGIPREQVLDEIIGTYKTGNIEKIKDIIKKTLNDGGDPESLAGELINRIISNPDPASIHLLSKLVDIKAPFAEAKLILALLATDQPTVQPTTQSVIQSPIRPATYTTTRPVASPTQSSTQFTTQQPNQKSSVESGFSAAKQALLARQAARKNAEKSAPTQNTENITKSSENSQDSTEQSQPSKDSQEAPSAANQGPNSFSWDSFISNIKADNGAVYRALVDASCTIDGTTIRIMPSKKIFRGILKNSNNSQVLMRHVPAGIKLVIEDEPSSTIQNDSTLGQISDIMGGVQEVNNGGEIPF